MSKRSEKAKCGRNLAFTKQGSGNETRKIFKDTVTGVLKLSKEFGLYFTSVENTVEGLGKGGRFFTKCGLD